MNTRCKPDDIAFIEYVTLGCESNIGRLVIVRGPSTIDHKGKLTWLITPLGDEPYVIENLETGGFRWMEPGETRIEHPDDWMQPLTLIDDPDADEDWEDTPSITVLTRSPEQVH